MVLTTAATASEANGVSVLCHDVLHEKAALDEPLTRPRFALMNPVLTYTLPPRQTASCAVDIFSHAFERYFHKGQQGTLRSQMCAAVMRTVITELPRALAHPDSYDARSQLMWASTVAHSNMLGGLTGGLCLSRPLSCVYHRAGPAPRCGPGYPDDRMVQVYAHR